MKDILSNIVLFVLLATISLGNCRVLKPIDNDYLEGYYIDEKSPRFFFISDDDGNIQVVDTQKPIPRTDVAIEDVTFHLKTRSHPDRIQFDLFNASEILSTDFDTNKRTMFIIHGLNNNVNSKVNTLISAALLETEDWNIICVDWQKQANKLYPTALGAVPNVGVIVAKFIRSLQELTDLNLATVHMCGHSLGAHVAGKAGTDLDGKVAYIVGMDPANPFVDYDDVTQRLDPSDAQHVHVVHTNGKMLGIFKSLGHADFYPNGGKHQKGCIADIIGTCAHSRAYKYFAESITSNGFKAKSCVSYEDFTAGLCDDNEEAYMGGNNINTNASGSYYLDTADDDPYALG